MNIVNILANLTSKDQATNFLQEQQAFLNQVITAKDIEDARYYNPATPFAEAQKMSDNYKLMKRRIPMTIEYYKRKPNGINDTDAIESIEMYINPDKLNISNQKLKSKTYTRGGIFYHQWGDDHPAMSISGTVGFSGMRGIEQLEKIYYNSGSLLYHQDVGVEKVGGGDIAKYQVVTNNINDIAQAVVSGTTTNTQVNQAINNAKKIEPLNSNKIMLDINAYISNNISTLKDNASLKSIMIDEVNQLNFFYNQKLLSNITPNYHDLYVHTANRLNTSKIEPIKSLNTQLKVSLAQQLVNSFLTQKSVITAGTIGTLNENISKNEATSLANYIKTVNDLNTRSKVDKTIAFTGWNDIADEITDEWRPRVIFIYFEDRVYIGHFAFFSYARSADTMLIRYEMKFDIIRQIIITSTADDKTPTSDNKSNITSLNKQTTYGSINPVILNLTDYWQGDINDYVKTQPLNVLKIKILIIKEALNINSSINSFIQQNPGFPKTGLLSESDVVLLNNNLKILRTNAYFIKSDGTRVSIPDNDPLYGTNLLNYEQVLSFFALAKYSTMQSDLGSGSSSSGTPNLTTLYYGLSEGYGPAIQKQVINLVKKELQRSKNVYNYLGSINKLTLEKVNQIYTWVKQVRAASGVNDDLWENNILNFSYPEVLLGTPTGKIIEYTTNSVTFQLDPVPNAQHYIVEIWKSGASSYTKHEENNIAKTFLFNNLNPDTNYEVRFYATGSGDYKKSLTTILRCKTLASPKPGIPSNISVRAVGNKNVNITFIKGINSNATDIDISWDNKNWGAIEYTNQANINYTIPFDNTGKVYFRLRSIQDKLNPESAKSSWSETFLANVY